MSKALLFEALDLLKAGDFQLGAELDSAHEISQNHEGDPSFDWIHALVHRIEGDNANADYWYRRAGKSRHAGSIDEEWLIVRSELEKG